VTLLQARTQSLRHYIRERQGRIIYNWPEIAEIRRKTGCNKRQLDQIIEGLEEAGEVLLGMRGGYVVVKLVNNKEKAPKEGNPAALEERGDKQNACSNSC